MVVNVTTRAILALPHGLFSCDSVYSVGLEGRIPLISGRYSLTVSLKLRGKCSALPVGASPPRADAQKRADAFKTAYPDSPNNRRLEQLLSSP